MSQVPRFGDQGDFKVLELMGKSGKNQSVECVEVRVVDKEKAEKAGLLLHP